MAEHPAEQDEEPPKPMTTHELTWEIAFHEADIVRLGAVVGIDALRWSQEIAARVLPDAVGNTACAFVADALGPVIWALPGIVAAALFAYHRRPRPNCCRSCGYDLTGNTSGRCPECGRPC